MNSTTTTVYFVLAAFGLEAVIVSGSVCVKNKSGGLVDNLISSCPRPLVDPKYNVYCCWTANTSQVRCCNGVELISEAYVDIVCYPNGRSLTTVVILILALVIFFCCLLLAPCFCCCLCVGLDRMMSHFRKCVSSIGNGGTEGHIA